MGCGVLQMYPTPFATLTVTLPSWVEGRPLGVTQDSTSSSVSSIPNATPDKGLGPGKADSGTRLPSAGLPSARLAPSTRPPAPGGPGQPSQGTVHREKPGEVPWPLSSSFPLIPNF